MENFRTDELDGALSADATTLQAALRKAIERRPIMENSYLQSLGDGSMDLAGFQRSQLQFFYAVRFFPRSMAALAARLPNSRSRMPLVRNLTEEHGDFHAAQAHDNTFEQFLKGVGVDTEDLNCVSEGPEVSAFNYALLGTCSMADPKLALACLGIIEHTFASISAFIGDAVVRRGWVGRGNLVHYTLHAEIDKRHADEFFREVETGWAQGGQERRSVEAGLTLGLHLFDRLYRDLHVLATPPI